MASWPPGDICMGLSFASSFVRVSDAGRLPIDLSSPALAVLLGHSTRPGRCPCQERLEAGAGLVRASRSLKPAARMRARTDDCAHSQPLSLFGIRCASPDARLISTACRRRTFKRPGVDAFLKHMSQFYEIVVYTDQLPTFGAGGGRREASWPVKACPRLFVLRLLLPRCPPTHLSAYPDLATAPRTIPSPAFFRDRDSASLH